MDTFFLTAFFLFIAVMVLAKFAQVLLGYSSENMKSFEAISIREKLLARALDLAGTGPLSDEVVKRVDGAVLKAIKALKQHDEVTIQLPKLVHDGLFTRDLSFTVTKKEITQWRKLKSQQEKVKLKVVD
ncbi:MAG: hypothetical protein V4629_09700 [Pseudomonadota bacterium]